MKRNLKANYKKLSLILGYIKMAEINKQLAEEWFHVETTIEY